MTWVSTRALVEGKEPGYGAGSGGVAIFPCAAGLCSFFVVFHIFKIAKKKFGDKILAIFCSWNGGLGLARFRRRRRRRRPS